ncbi:DUF2946 family protein [Neokomagataea tanensis]|uniref:DUF2946 family protein n=1 Tax=Neokomagataea TaxID=1223423 RepID=UPI00114475BD|nr:MULTISPECIES: DUF2946 family protein [Neokomagataea]
MSILVGLSGQLTLQTQSLPDESPKATLERLTGVRIGPQASPMAAHCMANMALTSMRQGHQQHTNSCPLCPLLHLPAIILGLAIIALLISLLQFATTYAPPAQQNSPARSPAFLPPSTGPPTFA